MVCVPFELAGYGYVSGLSFEKMLFSVIFVTF